MITEKIDPLAVIGTQASMARVEGRAECANDLDAVQARVAELVAAALEVADEHMGLAGTTIYHHEYDEVGTRACCDVVSYADHESDCPAVRLRAALAAFK